MSNRKCKGKEYTARSLSPSLRVPGYSRKRGMCPRGPRRPLREGRSERPCARQAARPRCTKRYTRFSQKLHLSESNFRPPFHRFPSPRRPYIAREVGFVFVSNNPSEKDTMPFTYSSPTLPVRHTQTPSRQCPPPHMSQTNHSAELHRCIPLELERGITSTLAITFTFSITVNEQALPQYLETSKS